MISVKKNFRLGKITSTKLGGPAQSFVEVRNISELKEALRMAKKSRRKVAVIGEGSNLIISDQGYKGMVLQIKVREFRVAGNKVVVGAGNNLLTTIRKLNKLGLGGLEKMAGIPGSIGGAIYGCAGAYGQEIKDHLISVDYFNGRNGVKLTRKQIKFGYRTSIFKKHKNWIILSATFRLKKTSATALQRESRQIILKRGKKYRPGLKCPGSFFKNLKLSDLPVSQVRALKKKIDQSQIMYGKLPTGYLLEQVGAKGMRSGNIQVAKHHANLIYNAGGGAAKDVKNLARKLKQLVKNRYQVIIQEEVQYLGFRK